MRKIAFLLIIVILSMNVWGQSPSPSGNHARRNANFDGKWWLEAEAGERSGFINGAADCLTWSANEKGFNATPEQVADQISAFYKAHPQSTDVTVADAWKKTVSGSITPKAPETKGQIWKNAHWYLNGNWWGQISRPEAIGYLEGYLWCMDNRVAPKTETYSQPVAFYQEKIDAYVQAHPKSGDEAVALILSRFRDQPSRIKAGSEVH